MTRYHLRTLGGLVLSRTDQPGEEITLADSKALLLLAVLATKSAHTARRAELAELFWPEGDRARALRALRQALFFLSKHADGALLRDGESVTLNTDAVSVDLWEFDEAVARNDHTRVLALYTGRFAAGLERKVGLELEHWIEAVDSRLRVGVEVAYAREIPGALAEHDEGRAARLAREFVALNPLDEDRQHLLARTLLTAGDRVGALQVLEEYRKVAGPLLPDESPTDLDERVETMRRELLQASGLPAASPAATAPEPARGAPVFTIAGYPITRTMLMAAGTVVLASTAGAALLSRNRAPSADPFADLHARLLAVVERGSPAKVVELGVQASGIAVIDRNDLQPADLPTPDGTTVATMIQAPDGWNLAIRTASGEPHMLTALAGDEYPLGWSPDGRYLMYGHREVLADGRTESNSITVYDVQADSGWALAALTSRERPSAAWSPDGTHIAFTADVRGAPEVFVIRFDGSGLRDISRNPAWDAEPAWSPDHEQVAFISRRSGHTEVYTSRADGSDLRRVTQTSWEKHRPIWLSPVVLAFEVERDGERSLRVLSTFTGQSRDLGGAEGLVRVVALRQPVPPWIATVGIRPRTDLGSPGQHLAFTVDVRGADDTPLVAEGLPIDWSVTDRAVAVPEGAGRVRVVGTGQTAIVANAAGWRADTLMFFSVPLVVRPAQPAFAESWRAEPDSARWRLFGDPLPTTARTGGPRNGGVFLNNGDAFFASGAVTRDAFPLKDGLSVEVDGRAPFTGKLHQEFGVALYPDDYPDSVLASGSAPATVEFRMRGPSGSDAAEAWVGTPDWRETLPMPDDPGAWHSYALQVLADGTVDLVVDGRLFWRSSAPLARRTSAVHVALGFQSFNTRILHGPVRVFIEPRYELPQVTVTSDRPSSR